MLDIKHGDDGRIVLVGRFDASQVTKAQSVFDALEGPSTIDFTGLEYISSAGLGVLLKTQKRIVGSDGRGLTFVNVNSHINDIFRYSGFDQIFEIHVAS